MQQRSSQLPLHSFHRHAGQIVLVDFVQTFRTDDVVLIAEAVSFFAQKPHDKFAYERFRMFRWYFEDILAIEHRRIVANVAILRLHGGIEVQLRFWAGDSNVYMVLFWWFDCTNNITIAVYATARIPNDTPILLNIHTTLILHLFIEIVLQVLRACFVVWFVFLLHILCDDYFGCLLCEEKMAATVIRLLYHCLYVFRYFWRTFG